MSDKERDFKVGDYVLTPTDKLAQVRGIVGQRLRLRYVHEEPGTPPERNEVNLLPEVCRRA